MTKTARDVTAEALRTINVTAIGDEPSADDHTQALAHLTSIFATLDETEGMALDWTIETVPDHLFLPLSQMVAGSVCIGYERPQFAALYQSGLRRMRAAEFGNEPAFTAAGVFF